MTTEPIRYEVITVSQIREFAAKAIAEAGDGGWVPITRQRAAAHAANPHAAPEDPAMVVAYSGEEWVGYLGLVPGLLQTPTGLHKMLWFSTLFVDPERRGQGIGGGILATFTSLGYDAVGAETSDAAERLYRSLELRELGPLISYRAAVPPEGGASLSSWALRAAGRVLSLVGLDRRRLDAAIEAGARRDASRHRAARFRELANEARASGGVLHYRLQVDPFPAGYPPPFTPEPSRSQRAHFHRGPETIDWMLHRKWIVSDAEAPDNVRYVFSNTRRRFSYAYASLSSADGRSAGGVVFSLSRHFETDAGHLKMLDYHLEPGVRPEAVVAVLLDVAGELEAGAFEFPAEFRCGPLAGGGRLDLRTTERPYFCMHMIPGGPLASAADQIVLNFCDGDSAFI